MSNTRNSSIELFRIIAMLFVVIVHCNGWLVGGIPEDFDENNISTFRVSQATIQAFTCSCVNMFLLISGYFGLKLKWKSILKIYMLLISVTIPFYLVNCYLGDVFSFGGLLAKFFAISSSGYFVECYLFLMFFSPVLNAFVEKEGKRMLYWTLSFWTIEIYFEFLIHDEDLGFSEGYSFIHFVLIYMIGRTIYLYRDVLFNMKESLWSISYLLFVFAILFFYVFLDMRSAYFYTCPFNVLASCSLFIVFAKRTFYSKWINWIASSTFAVYIIHIHQPVIHWLRTIDVKILEEYSYSRYILIMGGIIIIIFVGGVLYDKTAKLFTSPVVNYVDRQIQRVYKCLSLNLN